MSLTLVTQIPFTFSVDGPPRGADSSLETIIWSFNIRVRNVSGDEVNASISDFVVTLPGQRPDGSEFPYVNLIHTGEVDTGIGIISYTTTYPFDDLQRLTGDFHVEVTADTDLTVLDLTTDYGGFSVSWNGFDTSTAEWDPVPSFSDDPGVEPETPLDPADYDISFIDFENSSEWFEEISLIIPPDEGGGGGDDGGEADDRRFRVWGFSLDGHDMAVFRLGDGDTLVYDLSIGDARAAWSHWASPGRENWRAHVGQNWIGMSAATLDRGFGTDVVCGDDSTPTLWVLDPTTGRDDNDTAGNQPFTRKVTGGLSLDGREVQPCNALTLQVSLGAPTQDGAAFVLRTKDNYGLGWVDHGTQEITGGAYNAVIEWRGLGLARAPGRVFEISDNGASVRISRADLR